MTEKDAIIQLNFDMEMIRFNPDTGETRALEEIKARNEDNYKTYLADELAITALIEIQQYRAIGMVEEFKKCKEELELYRNLDKTNYHDGYRSAIDDVVCKISDYKEKHYHNREEYPINYGLLCDMENWFLEMKGEKQ